jgi:hypothetical protein
VVPNAPLASSSTTIPTISQTIYLLLPFIGPLLGFIESLLQLLDIVVLFRVAFLLLVRFPSIMDAFPESHGRRERAHKRRG